MLVANITWFQHPTHTLKTLCCLSYRKGPWPISILGQKPHCLLIRSFPLTTAIDTLLQFHHGGLHFASEDIRQVNGSLAYVWQEGLGPIDCFATQSATFFPCMSVALCFSAGTVNEETGCSYPVTLNHCRKNIIIFSSHILWHFTNDQSIGDNIEWPGRAV